MSKTSQKKKGESKTALIDKEIISLKKKVEKLNNNIKSLEIDKILSTINLDNYLNEYITIYTNSSDFEKRLSDEINKKFKIDESSDRLEILLVERGPDKYNLSSDYYCDYDDIQESGILEAEYKRPSRNKDNNKEKDIERGIRKKFGKNNPYIRLIDLSTKKVNSEESYLKKLSGNRGSYDYITFSDSSGYVNYFYKNEGTITNYHLTTADTDSDIDDDDDKKKESSDTDSDIDDDDDDSKNPKKINVFVYLE